MGELHKTDNEYILDVLLDEEERLMDKIADTLPDEFKYLVYRYLAVKDKIRKVKSKTA
ncbi:hypothetical protein [Clostridium saccharoperbutylacetonicum]|uniref:hypothetical protein n=1 Tax=Clostridium saccharoperbutylacetonicum TaxID=36745 RepID=UPI0039E8D17A